MGSEKAGLIIKGINKVVGAFTWLWNHYNGFLFIALIIGISNFYTLFFLGGPADYVAMDTFFSLNSIIASFGILYIVGVCLLLFYICYRIIRIHTYPENSITGPSYLFICSILFIFLAFDILAYVYFIILPFPFPQMEVYINMGHYFIPSPFEINRGFISTLVLTSLIITGMTYDIIYAKLTLRQLYKMYLPTYAPKKVKNMIEET